MPRLADAVEQTLPVGMTPRLLGRIAAAAYCGVSPTTFDEYIADCVPPIAIGSRKLWDVKALDRWIDQQSGLAHPGALQSISPILKAMADNHVDALAYPTIRRKANLIGEPQMGNNCHLSANSGLPAITVPGGFTQDGLPVGVELLGRAWSEPQLIKFAYAYEQATRHRHPPASTPALDRR